MNEEIYIIEYTFDGVVYREIFDDQFKFLDGLKKIIHKCGVGISTKVGIGKINWVDC